MENTKTQIQEKPKPKPAQKKFFLTDEQKIQIREHWNKRVKERNTPTLGELTELIFGEKDSRTKAGRVIREYLASISLKARVGNKAFYEKQKPVTLTKEQEEYISNHAATRKPLEIAKTLFGNPNLGLRSQELVAVQNFYRDLPEECKIVSGEDQDDGTYSTVKSVRQAWGKIRGNVENSGFDKNYEELSARQIKQLESTKAYLNSYRFRAQYAQFESNDDKRLFENSFIRYVYNKEDLSEEDIDQFINLSTEVVISYSTYARLERLKNLLDAAAEEANEGERRAITMTLVESIGKTQDDYNASQKRINQLYTQLIKTRSARLKEKIDENQSLLTLVQAFQDKDKREKLVEFAQKRKNKVKKEINRLETISDLKCEIYGIDPAELLDAPI